MLKIMQLIIFLHQINTNAIRDNEQKNNNDENKSDKKLNVID